MRIYIIPAWYPQHEKDITACFFREQAHALANRGHDVTVLHIEPISFTQIGKRPRHETRIWTDGNIRTVFQKVIIPVPGKLNSIQEAYLSKVFYRIIAEQIAQDKENGMAQPDILHAHVSHTCGYYCLKAAQKLNIPLVVTEHYSGLLLGTATKREYTRVRKTIEMADAFIFVGSNFRKSICERLHTTKDTYVIPNLITDEQLARFAVQEDASKNDNVFTFVTACHLTPNKRVDLVIRAFHEAFGRDEAVRLLIAGDGVEIGSLKALASELKEEERIIFYGRYAREECADIYGHADAFVLTSQVETFGIVYLEAMAYGLPCIGTKGQGGEDIIDQDSGYLVESGDIQQLAEAMKTVLSNIARFDRELIRKRVYERFSEEKIGKSLEVIYRDKLYKNAEGGVSEYAFLVACHLKAHKRVDIVIRAFHNTFSQSNVRLLIAGEGDQFENLTKLVCELGEENRIRFLGRYAREEVARIFQMADAFVLVSEVEPFGIVYIEAMAAGLPCIATKGQGGDDIIDDKSGLLVKEGDEKALEQAMMHFRQDHEAYRAADIKAYCRQRFSEAAICSKLEQVYAECLTRTYNSAKRVRESGQRG